MKKADIITVDWVYSVYETIQGPIDYISLRYYPWKMVVFIVGLN